ncbi:type I secretion system permease/ATPase [Campylobacter concisus]|jgi:type I secretion system ATPase|uniref:Type I secretion system permease/ATPase n=1 Tax=Campylobacter concisus TaxID=199 RepID=A0A1X0TWG4_9BACT|nr:type I secretion system permease/ATPase [Campylobacter concisus]RKV87228.1 MAG: type I secretion system permease/ATPase [Campylobacter sp.]ORI04324.1 ABC transporter [Campylobacter concisus]ORI12458.1 ABC transporter [Campylobacter concisus]OSQ25489.1 type I secretion system permease/ATPase [Campylobacter concisus]OUT15125.1 type I secretion system permease/ATPase [Campylobacter concisus]
MHSDKIKDELLQCLVIFTKLHNNPYSADALTIGLPVKDGDEIELFSLKSSRSLFSRAASRAGFASTLVRKDLEQISPLVLPCILMLRGKKACILQSFSKDKKTANIITPELSTGTSTIEISKLKEEYLGYAYYLKREFVPEDTSSTKLIDAGNDHWFWGTLKRSKKIYFDVVLASFIINLFVLASPLFTMNVYDRVVPNNAVETLWVLALGVSVVYGIDLFLKFVRSYFLEIAGKKSDIIMSSILFERVMDMKFSNKPKSVGSFASNLKEFDTVRNFFSSASLAAIVDLPFAIIFLIVTYFIGSYIVLVPIVIMIAILCYTFFIKDPLQNAIKSTFEASAIKNGILIESLSSLETIKTLGASGHIQWNWEEATGEIANRSIKSKIITTSITTVTSFLVQLNTIAIIVLGVYMIQDTHLTMGGLIAAVMLSSRAIAPMGQVASLAANFEQTKTAYQSLSKIMQMPVERPEGKKFVRRNSFDGKIEFKNVSFTYPDTTKGSLDRINFVIQPGEKVGIIGKNGSGKTTLQKLILGLYSPTEGSVLIDGIDINQIDPADLRRNIGYVPQDVVLFKGTVRENIVQKAPYVDDIQIIKAAKVSGVDEYVNAHPLGFDMPVFERGDGISGGQRQSIAVARAFLLDSPIILLDEPTNSLDNTVENKLKINLKTNTANKTMLLVTHRTSMLDLVDRLIVMDNGKILLDGPRDEVLARLSGK